MKIAEDLERKGGHRERIYRDRGRFNWSTGPIGDGTRHGHEESRKIDSARKINKKSGREVALGSGASSCYGDY